MNGLCTRPSSTDDKADAYSQVFVLGHGQRVGRDQSFGRGRTSPQRGSASGSETGENSDKWSGTRRKTLF